MLSGSVGGIAVLVPRCEFMSVCAQQFIGTGAHLQSRMRRDSGFSEYQSAVALGQLRPPMFQQR